MLGLRTKLSFGFAGLLLIIVIIGIQGILQVNDLGQSIDVILRENYRSVIACQDMKESIERIDSGILFVLLGYESEGTTQIERNLTRFEKAVQVEGGNLTLPREGEAFQRLQSSFAGYKAVLERVRDVAQPIEQRRSEYFAELLPLFHEIKTSSDDILHMNQQNMSDANMAARSNAAAASQRMYLLLICGAGIATMFILAIRAWILRPIAGLIKSAEEIQKGNLDLVVSSSSKDELGQLSRTFDAMTASLRESRRAGKVRLARLQQAMQQAFHSVPDAMALIDLDGNLELVTENAVRMFGLRSNMALRDIPYPRAALLCNEAMTSGQILEETDNSALLQRFVDGEEYFFRTKAIPVLDDDKESVGAILLFDNVTHLHQRNEVKSGLVSTVSHQLKTPLTSIRMALYLLLDEKLGALNPKQEELVIAARDDSDRLHTIVEDLLDIARIQSGRIAMELSSVDATLLAMDSVEPYKTLAQDSGLSLSVSIPAVLPKVQADPTRIEHVFGNLLSNAIKYTAPGGSIQISAWTENDVVWYCASDTGVGIAPEHLPRVFEQFFRVPDQGANSGAGLGLAIAREIVMAHGGEMYVESQPGKGSIFTFSLRIAG